MVSDLKLNLNLRDYSMDDLKVTELAKDAALITYRFRQKGSQKGKDFSSQDYLSAVYVKRGGEMAVRLYPVYPGEPGDYPQVRG